MCVNKNYPVNLKILFLLSLQILLFQNVFVLSYISTSSIKNLLEGKYSWYKALHGETNESEAAKQWDYGKEFVGTNFAQFMPYV